MADANRSILTAFELVDRVVWVVTAAADGRASGLLATWVMQSSLDPERPRVSVSLNSWHFTTRLILQSGTFGLHLLRTDQPAVAWRFGLTSGSETDKFAGLATNTGATGAPLLADCLAALECRVLLRAEIADRICIWADVVAGQAVPGKPLTSQALIATASPAQQILLRGQLDRDIGRERIAWQAFNVDRPSILGGQQPGTA